MSRTRKCFVYKHARSIAVLLSRSVVCVLFPYTNAATREAPPALFPPLVTFPFLFPAGAAALRHGALGARDAYAMLFCWPCPARCHFTLRVCRSFSALLFFFFFFLPELPAAAVAAVYGASSAGGDKPARCLRR